MESFEAILGRMDGKGLFKVEEEEAFKTKDRERQGGIRWRS